MIVEGAFIGELRDLFRRGPLVLGGVPTKRDGEIRVDNRSASGLDRPGKLKRRRPCRNSTWW